MNTRPTFARAAEICARLITGQSQTSLRRQCNIGARSLETIIRTLEEYGVSIPKRGQDQPRVSPAFLDSLFENDELSNRAIARKVGYGLETVRRYRLRYNRKILEAGGSLPLCGCGQYLHHSRICAFRAHSRGTRDGSPFPELDAAAVAAIRSALIEGERLASVSERSAVTASAVKRFVRTLSTEERAQRERNRQAPAATRRAAAAAKRVRKPLSTDPRNDRVWARIVRALPRWADPSVRHDIVSDAYVAVMLGRMRQRDIPSGVARLARANMKAFANPWGDLSLDTPIADGSGMTFAETIEDPRALAAFGQLDAG